MRREQKLVAFYKLLVPYSASEVMALVWQMFRLLVNLPNFSSCFSKFLERGGELAALHTTTYNLESSLLQVT